MATTDTLRTRYAQASDDDLRAMLDAGTTQMEPGARAILMAEVRRRHMLGDVSPLDKLAWPAEVPEASRYSKVGFGKRVLAYIIDALYSGLPLIGCAMLTALGFAVAGNLGGIAAAGILGMICSLGWAIYYSFVKDGREGGQSVGKKALNLMVVNITTNEPCSKRESFTRQLDLFFLQMIPLVGWLVEPIVMLSSKDGRRIGDRAADTQVIEVSEYQPATIQRDRVLLG